MICVALPARSNDEMRRMMRQAAPEADLLELRIDGLPEPDLPRLLAERPRPVIVTNRPPHEGGRWTGSETRRLALLEEAACLGAEYVDIELAAGPVRCEGARRIVSVHDFEGVPADLPALHRRIARAGADIVKIAVTARTIMDTLPVFDLLERQGRTTPTIALAMGEAGQITRILSPRFGGFLTYAAEVFEGRERGSAPGQLTARRLREEFRYGAIGRGTALYGVIGNPVAHSLSPAIHNAAFAETGAEAVYVPLWVEDVRTFVPAFRRVGFRGFSVTLPHKVACLDVADEVDDLARRIGAANTLYERDGRLHAANSDCAAAVAALERAFAGRPGGGKSLRGRRVVVLGAGGAARAVVFGLVERGAEVVLVNRTHEKAVRLAADVGANCRVERMERLPDTPFDALCNVTSVGMYPNVDALPVPEGVLKPEHIVFDAVYNPLETRLIRTARALGCTVVPGLDWFIGQAAVQFELWTGRPAPTDAMRRAALARLAPSEA